MTNATWLAILHIYGKKDGYKIHVLRVKIKRVSFKNNIFEEVGGI